MKNLIEIINEISEKAKGKLKPDLIKYGKNFRAISESAILETLNPLFKEYNIGYEVIIQEQKLVIEKVNAGRDASGNLIQKLVFVGEAKVILVVHNYNFISFDKPEEHQVMCFHGWGSGVDAGDKATGKAITAAVKYALFKGLRLQYSDDPDAEASEEIETIAGKEEEPKERKQEKKSSPKEKKKEDDEPLATEAQLNYIKGLAVACGISDEEFKNKYGFYPYETNIPMRKARELIDELKKLQDSKLPF